MHLPCGHWSGPASHKQPCSDSIAQNHLVHLEACVWLCVWIPSLWVKDPVAAPCGSSPWQLPVAAPHGWSPWQVSMAAVLRASMWICMMCLPFLLLMGRFSLGRF